MPLNLAPFIDHGTAEPNGATPEQVQQWCADVDRYGFAAVCVFPAHVRQAVELLHQRPGQVCTVIGFPHPGRPPHATEALRSPGGGLNMEQQNSECLRCTSNNWDRLSLARGDAIHREMAVICEETGQTIKAILETALLTPSEIALAAEVVYGCRGGLSQNQYGCKAVATVGGGQATSTITAGRVGIKASGGIRTAAQAVALIQAGATRIGTSRGPLLGSTTAEPGRASTT